MSTDDCRAGSDSGASGASVDLPLDLESDDFIDSLLSAVESQVIEQMHNEPALDDTSEPSDPVPDTESDTDDEQRPENRVDAHPSADIAEAEADGADPDTAGAKADAAEADGAKTDAADPDTAPGRAPNDVTAGDTEVPLEVDEELFGEALGLLLDESEDDAAHQVEPRRSAAVEVAARGVEPDRGSGRITESRAKRPASGSVGGQPGQPTGLAASVQLMYTKQPILVVGAIVLMALGLLAVIVGVAIAG